MIAVIGDIHLKSNEKFGIFNKVNTRTLDKINLLNSAVTSCIDKGVTAVYFLGDVFDSINPGVKVKSMFFEIVAKLIMNKINVYIILGNHDFNTIDIHGFMVAESLALEYLHIVKDVVYGDITMAPYKKTLKEDCTGKILLGHMEIEGYYPEYNVEKALLNRFSIVLNGHYHHQDEYHAGSFCVCNRGEIDKPHGYYIIDEDTLVSNFISVKDRHFVKIDSSIENLKEEIAKHEYTDDTIISIKVEDSKENLKTLSIFDIKRLIPVHHKVVVDKKVTTESKHITKEDSGSYDLKEDIGVYCKKVDPTMEKHGLKILEMSSANN